jgi:hypothetical protein
VKLPLWVKWIWWLGLVTIISIVLWKRLDLTAAGRSTAFDSVVFVVWVALLLAPIFSEVKIWGVELKQEIKDVKKDLSEQIHAVRADVRNSISLQAVFSNAVPAPPFRSCTSAPTLAVTSASITGRLTPPSPFRPLSRRSGLR